jgi:hypothetical protein
MCRGSEWCETEDFALLCPIEGHSGPTDQLGSGETGRLPAFEDGRDDIGCQETDFEQIRCMLGAVTDVGSRPTAS